MTQKTKTQDRIKELRMTWAIITILALSMGFVLGYASKQYSNNIVFNSSSLSNCSSQPFNYSITGSQTINGETNKINKTYYLITIECLSNSTLYQMAQAYYNEHYNSSGVRQ